jgi:hypothetical protein
MEAGSRSHLHSPYPELVERELHGRPYRIRDSLREATPSRGMVDLRNRVMWVPLEPGARSVARHEQGHVRWSPPHPPRVRFDPRVLLCVEDARVNLGLVAAGLPVEEDALGRARVELLFAEDAKRRDGFALFARAIASIGTNLEAVLAAHLAASAGPLEALVAGWVMLVRAELEAARVRAGAVVAPHARGVSLARRLARELRALGLLDAAGRARTAVPACCLGAHRGGGEPGRRLRAKRLRALGLGADGEGADVVEAGRLHVVAAPLGVRLRPGRAGRSWRASGEGSVVRYLQRWPVDRAVFRRRARGVGGTLLVDTSGSMPFAAEDLDGLLLATPRGVRVAIYSGADEVGELRVVADGHRRASAEHLKRFGNGNVVDLPALGWLARQPGPRLWLSDGGVTGVGDRASDVLKERCLETCRRARIQLVPTIKEATRALRGQ